MYVCECHAHIHTFHCHAHFLQLPLLLEKQLEVSSLTSDNGMDLPTLALPILPLPSERLLKCQYSCLPPGQAVLIMQSYVRYLQEELQALHLQEMTCYHKMVLTSTANLFSLFLCHAPLSLWSGRSKVAAIDSAHILIEKVCPGMLELGAGEVPSSDKPLPLLRVTSLLLTSACCQLLTRLQAHLPPTTHLPKWPLHLTLGGQSHQLLPEQWVGVAPSHPILKLLLVRINYCLWFMVFNSLVCGSCCVNSFVSGQTRLAIEEARFVEVCGSDLEQLLDAMFIPDLLSGESHGLWDGQVSWGRGSLLWLHNY